MPENSWSEPESDNEFDPINSILAEWSDPEAEEE
jgi:1,2-diacylglycerol 3-beta-glucosyltransferase